MSLLRFISVLLFFSLFGRFATAETAAGENFEALFRKGLASYQTKDYGKAKEFFSEALKKEPGNTAAMTNYALASFQTNNKGEAIAWFRRVLAIEPERSEARNGLKYAMSKLEVKEIPHRIETYETLRQNVLSLATARMFLALTALLILAAGWTLLGWLGQRRRAIQAQEVAPPFTFSLGVLLTLAIAGAVLTGFKLYDQTLPRGTVIGAKIEARSAPAEDAAALFDLYDGFEVVIRETKDNWVQVTYPGGLTGWIPKDRLLPVTL